MFLDSSTQNDDYDGYGRPGRQVISTGIVLVINILHYSKLAQVESMDVGHIIAAHRIKGKA